MCLVDPVLATAHLANRLLMSPAYRLCSSYVAQICTSFVVASSMCFLDAWPLNVKVCWTEAGLHEHCAGSVGDAFLASQLSSLCSLLMAWVVSCTSQH